MCVIILISRNGSTIIPRGDTELLSGDTIMIMAKDDSIHKVQHLLKIDE